MAVSSVPQRTPTSKKSKKPDPSRIYQLYLYHVKQSGQRTAASLTAEALGISDDTVRRVVKRFEEPATPTDDELAFKLPPGAEQMEIERTRLAPEFAAKAAALLPPEPQPEPQPQEPDSGLFMSTPERETSVFAADEPQPEEAQSRTIELGNTPANEAQQPQPTPPPVIVRERVVVRVPVPPSASQGTLRKGWHWLMSNDYRGMIIGALLFLAIFPIYQVLQLVAAAFGG